MKMNRLVSICVLIAAAALFAQIGAANAQSIVAEIPFTNAAGTGVAVNQVTNKIYAAVNVTYYTPTSFLVIDGATNKITATIPDPNTTLGPYSTLLALNSRTNQIYVVHPSRDFVVIDGATNRPTTVTYTSQLREPTPVGFVVDEASNKAYYLERDEQSKRKLSFSTELPIRSRSSLSLLCWTPFR